MATLSDTKFPFSCRLKAGTRLLNPITGTRYKCGGKYVRVCWPTEDGKVVIRYTPKDLRLWDWANVDGLYFEIDPAAVGIEPEKIVKPVQTSLLDRICEIWGQAGG